MSAFRMIIFFLIGHSASALAQSSYPVIDKEVQQARDQERLLILNTELLAEHQELAKAREELAANPTKESQAKAHRHGENIKALQRELRGVGSAQASPSAPLRVVAVARRPPEPPPARSATALATYWNPYNRAAETRSPTDSSTTLRREAP